MNINYRISIGLSFVIVVNAMAHELRSKKGSVIMFLKIALNVQAK